MRIFHPPGTAGSTDPRNPVATPAISSLFGRLLGSVSAGSSITTVDTYSQKRFGPLILVQPRCKIGPSGPLLVKKRPTRTRPRNRTFIESFSIKPFSAVANCSGPFPYLSQTLPNFAQVTWPAPSLRETLDASTIQERMGNNMEIYGDTTTVLYERTMHFTCQKRPPPS